MFKILKSRFCFCSLFLVVLTFFDSTFAVPAEKKKWCKEGYNTKAICAAGSQPGFIAAENLAETFAQEDEITKDKGRESHDSYTFNKVNNLSKRARLQTDEVRLTKAIQAQIAVPIQLCILPGANKNQGRPGKHSAPVISCSILTMEPKTMEYETHGEPKTYSLEHLTELINGPISTDGVQEIRGETILLTDAVEFPGKTNFFIKVEYHPPTDPSKTEIKEISLGDQIRVLERSRYEE